MYYTLSQSHQRALPAPAKTDANGVMSKHRTAAHLVQQQTER